MKRSFTDGQTQSKNRIARMRDEGKEKQKRKEKKRKEKKRKEERQEGVKEMTGKKESRKRKDEEEKKKETKPVAQGQYVPSDTRCHTLHDCEFE